MLTCPSLGERITHVRRVFLDRLTRGNEVCQAQRQRNFSREMESSGCAGRFLDSSCSCVWLWCLPIFLSLIYRWSEQTAPTSRSCHWGTRLPTVRVPQREEDIDFNFGTI